MIYFDSAATTLEKPRSVPTASASAMTRCASPGRGGSILHTFVIVIKLTEVARTIEIEILSKQRRNKRTDTLERCTPEAGKKIYGEAE